jgi:hypothetical protein
VLAARVQHLAPRPVVRDAINSKKLFLFFSYSVSYSAEVLSTPLIKLSNLSAPLRYPLRPSAFKNIISTSVKQGSLYYHFGNLQIKNLQNGASVQ